MTVQIAVRLPDELLAAVDRLVDDGRYPSRSDVVRAGLERMVADAAGRMIDQAFADGVSAHPDTDDDLQRATALAIESIDDEPWEKWS
jgi:Arc/MetJ-type ribon-helix-helix transcriptional regulator